MQDCIFCRIAAGEIPSTKVYEDELLLSFEDVNPVAPTHVLIVPKSHIPTLNDVDEGLSDLLGRMIVKAKDIAREKGLADDGYRLVMNCKEGAGQSVFHIHLHLLGGRSFAWPPG